MHLIDDGNIMTYARFPCGIVFYTKAPTEVKQNKRELKNHSISCENSKCFPSNDQPNCFFDEEHISTVFMDS